MADFRVLGPVEVATREGLLPLAGLKQRATLAMLLLEANRVVPADRLAEQLYAGEPPATAVTQVQRQVSELRKMLAGHATVETRPPGYAIVLEPGQLDLDRFQRLLADADEARASGSPADAVRWLEQALALWRGPALADLTSEMFGAVRLPAGSRSSGCLRSSGKLEALGSATGRAESVAIEVQLIAAHPTRERFARHLMLALYRTGRQVEALATYRAPSRRWSRTTASSPGPELRELETRILRHHPALRAARARGLRRIGADGGVGERQAGAVLAVGELSAPDVEIRRARLHRPRAPDCPNPSPSARATARRPPSPPRMPPWTSPGSRKSRTRTSSSFPAAGSKVSPPIRPPPSSRSTGERSTRRLATAWQFRSRGGMTTGPRSRSPLPSHTRATHRCPHRTRKRRRAARRLEAARLGVPAVQRVVGVI